MCFAAGVHTIAYAYPHVKIVTAAVDPEVNDEFHIIPGIGKLSYVNKLTATWQMFLWEIYKSPVNRLEAASFLPIAQFTVS